MADYVDGFVLPVPKRKVKAYQIMSKKASKVWMDHGALEYIETVADDIAPKGIKYHFTKTVKCTPSETVIFSWIRYKSRAHRDKVNAKVMKDPRLAKMMKPGQPMPFDFKRMAYAGFKVFVKG